MSEPVRHGKYRWVIEYRDGKILNKYNADKTKNYYSERIGDRAKVVVDVHNASAVGLTDEKGAVIAFLDVPVDAVVFQRRRVLDARLNDSEFWLVGYRKREADNSVTVHYKAVYPDGKVDDHNGWSEKPWLYEPEWFSEEQV